MTSTPYEKRSSWRRSASLARSFIATRSECSSRARTYGSVPIQIHALSDYQMSDTSPQRSGRERLCVAVPGGWISAKHLPPSLCGCGQHGLKRGVSTCALPQRLPTLAERLGDLLPGQASGARKRNSFFLSGVEVAAKSSRNSQDFQRVRLCTCPDPLPRLPERLRGLHRHKTEPKASVCQHSFTSRTPSDRRGLRPRDVVRRYGCSDHLGCTGRSHLCHPMGLRP
jgi:hypothetical protein